MFRYFCFLIAFVLILLTVSYSFKKHQRTILWLSAIFILVGTFLLFGLGVIEVTNSTVTVCACSTLIVAGVLICGAEDVFRNKGKKKIEKPALQETAIQPGPVVLDANIDTVLARKVFAAAIEAGYMSENGACYKWNAEKVLLAYMCGRIYCGDKPKWDKIADCNIWKFGREGFFPESHLHKLFQTTHLGQSRRGRKDLPTPLLSEEVDKFFEQS